jgi:hypothetical protein
MTRTTRIIAGAGAALALIAAVLGTTLYVRARRARAAAAAEQQRTPGPSGPQAIAAADEEPTPAIWIDVHAPGPVWKAVQGNAWLKTALAQPLGQGFSSSWSAFLGTRGTDLAGAFEGTVLDLMAQRLLVDPFRVVFMAGPGATGTPAVLVPSPSRSAGTAFELLDGATRSGRYDASRCPGADKDLPEKLGVSRWLVADHAVFAARMNGRIAMAKNPVAVVQALCADLPAMVSDKGVDVSVTVARDGLGRETLLGATLLGLSDTSRFLFGLEGDRLVPRGIAGKLDQPARLEAAAPREELLKLLPVDAGVVLLATVNLPDAMDRASLKQHLAGEYKGKLLPRTVAVVWNPSPGTTQVALVWPERDARALKEAFTGPNQLVEKRACGHVVLASTGALAGAMERSCTGKSPSLLNASPAVAAGIKAPVSLGVNVNVGGVLSRLLADAYATKPPPAEKGAAPPPRSPSPEIEAARRLLEELPYFGLRGVADGGALTPGGFRS